MMRRAGGFVKWEYQGKPDLMYGSGATKWEVSLVWIAGLLTVSVYLWQAVSQTLNWVWWQWLIAGVIALDVGGGVVANALNSCKRFYHAPLSVDEPKRVQWMKKHPVFLAIHIHALIAAMVTGRGLLQFGVFWYLYILIASSVVLVVPLYLRRPVAFLFIWVGILLNIYIIAPLPGFEWLAPALMLKLIYGHAVQEEPYRPSSER